MTLIRDGKITVRVSENFIRNHTINCLLIKNYNIASLCISKA